MNLTMLERRIDGLAARLHPTIPPTRLELAARVGFEPDLWQRGFLASGSRQVLLNCSRQSGKSTIAALLACHVAVTVPAATVLIVSPGERQSKLLFRTVLGYYRALAEPVPADVANKLSLELRNGSQVHALPGSEATVRGFAAVTLLVIDEAARTGDDLMGSLRPMLAVSGGRLIALSTPAGRRGWWYEAWTSGVDWERYEIPATACPRIDATFLAQERLALPDHVYRSEYECQFVEDAGSVFRFDDIDAMLDAAVRPLFALSEVA